MGAPLPDRMDVVRALIEQAPDSAINQLDAALRSASAGQGLTVVRDIIAAELWDRTVRDGVFAPVLLLCAPRPDGFEQIQFPRTVVARLWRALKQSNPHLVAAALASHTQPDDGLPPVYDQLCREAAKGLQQGGDYAPVIQTLETFRSGAAAQFADHLVLAPLARGAASRLPGWIRNMTKEHAAAVRLMFKDAVTIVTDGSPRLMEMLQAQLNEPWRILRIVAAAVGQANDRYVADSEMAGFGERILSDIDRCLNDLRLFDVDGGAEAGVAAAHQVAVVTAEAAEFEGVLEVDKQGPWGVRLGKQKVLLAKLAEGHLKKCGKLVSEALPVLPLRPGCVRGDPRVDAPPDTRLVRRAMAGLTFFDRVRGSAAQGGYGTVRAKVSEEIVYGLNGYLEDLLAIVHAGETADMANARAYVDVGADFMGLLQDIKSAQIIRRRAAAA